MGKPVNAIWSRDAIDSFWNFQAESKMGQSLSFSRRHGKGIVSVLTSAESVARGAGLLDFGCGAGHLLPHLLDAQFQVWGVDSSTELTAKINETHGGAENWHGALTSSRSFDDGQFDVVTCIEVVEHLLDEELTPVILELGRLLKPGGTVFITTPNKEDVVGAETACPFCSSRYHYRQHMRSWTPSILQDLLEQCDFEVEFCNGVNFRKLTLERPFPNWRDWSFRTLRRAMGHCTERLKDRRDHRAGLEARYFQSIASVGEDSPHLCAVAKKRN